jgi:hypothetical protein
VAKEALTENRSNVFEKIGTCVEALKRSKKLPVAPALNDKVVPTSTQPTNAALSSAWDAMDDELSFVMVVDTVALAARVSAASRSTKTSA